MTGMDRDAVSPVIGTILMVVLTVFLASLIYILVTPLIDPDKDHSEEIIVLDQGLVTVNGPDDIDTFFNIIVVRSEKFYEKEALSFVVYSDYSVLLTNATITFEDADDNNRISVGDSIKLEGMTQEYHRGEIMVLYQGEMLAWSPILT